MLSVLKSENATGANAQIYTPAPLADAMSHMLMAGINPAREGQTVMDPAIGTGGLFRAAAQVMRSNRHDPTTVSWYGADIDDLAIAACAVNSLLWDLGPHILLCVANTLSEADWATRAAAQREEVLKLSESIRRDKLTLAAIRAAQHLTEVITTEADAESGDPAAS